MSDSPLTRVAWRSVAVCVSALLASGCVYYNGIYNAKAAARDGDARLRRGNDVDAVSFFQQSAEKAETVLVRHPKSSWRTYALYLAGRGAALAGQCEQGMPRLTEYLAQAGLDDKDRDRARVALGACDVRLSRLVTARARLDSLVDGKDAETARQARLWAARAALSAGDRDAVVRYLGSADDGVLPWELVRSSLSAQEYVRAESLLVQRAERGDYRDDVPSVLRDLWSAGRFDAVERILRSYDVARLRDASRATMHFTIGDLSLRAGRDTVARRHLVVAQELAGRDSVVLRESAARLSFMSLVRAENMRAVDTVVALQDSATRRSAFARRVNEQLLLVRLLAQQDEPTGASVFLAAEVARDSLRAIPLARSLFLRVAREIPNAPLAPQAWHAAALLSPDSTSEWNAVIRTQYPNSMVAAWLRGEDPATKPEFTSTPALLEVRWLETLRVWSDSVRKLRTTPRPPSPLLDRQ